MTDDQTNIPNVAEILAGVLSKIDGKLQPFLLAKLEIAPYRPQRPVPDRTEPLLGPLSENAADAADKIDLFRIQAHEF